MTCLSLSFSMCVPDIVDCTDILLFVCTVRAGPFWICTTLVFTIAVAGNLANYFHHSGEHYKWKYDFHKGLFVAHFTMSA